jgi:hypothetical protein
MFLLKTRLSLQSFKILKNMLMNQYLVQTIPSVLRLSNNTFAQKIAGGWPETLLVDIC